MSIKNVNIDNVNKGLIVGVDEQDRANVIVNSLPGCTDPSACNYNSLATEDDGSCILPHPTCLNLTENDPGYQALISGRECELVPLDVCTGCYIPGDPSFPKLSQTTSTGKSFEWCQFCGDPAADNYNEELANDDSKAHCRQDDMCVYTGCFYPESGLPVCTLPPLIIPVGTPQDIVDSIAENLVHDESKCVYAHPGCQCSGEDAVPLSGYCGDCMESQPLASSVTLEEGVAEGYCDCLGEPIGGYCDCFGNLSTVNCECGSSTPINSDYCDCNMVNPRSPICGCNGSSTGTALPNYDTIGVLDSNNSYQDVYVNNDPCDCDGTASVAYYYDNNGDGYGHSSDGIIYVCDHHFPSGSSLTISTPGSPVQGGWSTNESPCLDSQKDCAGKCPSEFNSVYGTSLPSALNECAQCIPPSNQTGDWETECCAATIEAECSICSDDFDNGVTGALSYNKSASDGQDLYTINYVTAEGGTGTITTCNCAGLDGKNYYSDNLQTEIYASDSCGSCVKTSEGLIDVVDEAIILRTGAVGGVMTKDASQVYCGCGDSTPIPDNACCGGKIKACDGNCYDAGDSNAPQPDCSGDCGGNKIQTNCCDCVDITAPGNEDCNRDCCGTIGCDGLCDSGLVLDECGVCGGNNSTCTGCTDSDALNYDSTATVSCTQCCEYAVPTENLYQIITEAGADATGTKVESNNFLSPFAFSEDKVYWEGLPASLALTNIYNGYFAGSFTPSSLDAYSYYGWKNTNLLSGEYDDLNDVKWTPQVILPRVQFITPTNLKIVCERPQDNAVISYNVSNSAGELILSNLLYHGSGINVNSIYNNIYSTDLDNYANVSQIKYYFAIDASVNFDSTNLNLLFKNVGDKILHIKKVTGADRGSYISPNITDIYPWATPTGSLVNFEKGTSDQVTVSQGTFDIYNIYEISVYNGSEFTVDLESIAGLLTPPPVYGCTDGSACNFNGSANTDDGSCTYAAPGKYCDGTDIPIYGCMDSSADNYNPNANTLDPENPCEYLGCTNPNATNYDPLANVSCDDCCDFPLPCEGLGRSPICCQPGFNNSSEDFSVVDGIRVATNECEICDSTMCQETIYVCPDESALNFFTGEYNADTMIWSSSACNYPSPTPSNVHTSFRITNINSITQAQLDELKWIVYDTSGNIVAESKLLDISKANSLNSVDLELSDIVNIESNKGCLWFIPLGYKENSIWENVEFDIVYSGKSIHSLYGKNTPTVINGEGYDKSKNYSSSNEDGTAVITQYGECILGCDKNLDVLKTQYCEAGISKGGGELTHVFLIATTAQQADADYSEAYVEVFNINDGKVMATLRGMEPGKTYDTKFILTEATSIGIKASNGAGQSMSYKLISGSGELITTKTIK